MIIFLLKFTALEYNTNTRKYGRLYIYTYIYIFFFLLKNDMSNKVAYHNFRTKNYTLTYIFKYMYKSIKLLN